MGKILGWTCEVGFTAQTTNPAAKGAQGVCELQVAESG